VTDRNGTPLAIGDPVEWTGMDGTQCIGWVRRLESCPARGTPVAVVDDGARDNPELLTNGFHEARVIDESERIGRVP
jgi:hypothetical protein